MGMTKEEFDRRLREYGINPDDLGEAAEQRGKIDLERIKKTYKLGKEDINARMKIAGMESGDRRAALEVEREKIREEIKLAREEMERVNIPRVEIERFNAETTRETARSELAYKREALEEERRQFDQQFGFEGRKFDEDTRRYERDFGESARRFDTQFGFDERKFDEDTRRFGLEYALSQAGLTGTFNGMDTLEKQKFLEDRRQFGLNYGLQVAQFGAELASTPDTYYQGQRFQGTDLPRLMAGAAAPTTRMEGSPVPQINRLAEWLGPAAPAGYAGDVMAPHGPIDQYGNPVGTPYGGPPAAGAVPAAPLSAQEQARFEQLVARRAQTGGPLDPTDEDELRRFQARGARAPQDVMAPHGPIGPDGDQLRGITDPGFDPGAAGRRIPVEPAPRYGGPSPSPAPTGGIPDIGSGGDPGYMHGSSYGVAADGQGLVGMPNTPDDDRAKQIAAIIKAAPPSPYDGLNEQDAAGLRLIESIYKRGGQGIARGELERLQASGRKGFINSGGRLLGYDPKELDAQYAAYTPTQGSGRSA